MVLLKGLDLFVANVGDTRCVLCQRGKAIAMTEVHEPSRPSEVNRITRAGGDKIWAMKGRVEGEMRMSRALGKFMSTLCKFSGSPNRFSPRPFCSLKLMPWICTR